MRTAQGQAPTPASAPPTIFSPGAAPRVDNKRIASGATMFEIGGTTPQDIAGAAVVVVVVVVLVVVEVLEVVVVDIVVVVVVVVDVVDSVAVEKVGSAQQRVKSKSSKPHGKLMALIK